MNGLIKAVARIPAIRSIAHPLRSIIGKTDAANTAKRQFTRSFRHMCSPRMLQEGYVGEWKLKNPTNLCSCGCGIQRIHTKGEKELVEFLAEEIVNEQKAHKSKNIPSEVDGFKVHFEGSEVTLTKQAGDELIEINFNINHTVDAEADTEAEVNPNMDKPEFGELKSKPNFEVDIKRGSQTLSFTCSFSSDAPDEQTDAGYNDIFGIDEVTLFKNEWNEKCYAVAGDVLDGYLYDLLMNLLEEKGISNEFVDKLCELSTAYEHSSYIKFLEGLQKFASGK